MTIGTSAAPGPPVHRSLRIELIAGALLTGWTLIASLAIRADRAPNLLDRVAFAHLPHAPHATFWLRLTDLGGVPVLAGGSVLAALVVVGRDRRRAIACLCAPGLAAVAVDWVLKPEVGRYFLGELSFPSGSMTVVAALATAWTLAVPAPARWVVAAAGAVVVALVGVAVVAVRWHYPSDALAGVAFGAGVVLLVDGLLHLGGGQELATSGGGPDATADDHLRVGGPSTPRR